MQQSLAILDHLLHADTNAADVIINSLIGLGDDQKRFMQAYLSSAAERDQFVARFTTMSSRVLTYLVNQVDLDDAARLRLVTVVLAHLDSDIGYRVDQPVSGYLKTHFAELLALGPAPLTASQAQRIADLYSTADVRLPALTPLPATVIRAFVAQDLYAINPDNLQKALRDGDGVSLALDSVRNSDKRVYTYVLANLDTYLSLDDVPCTIETNLGVSRGSGDTGA